MFTKSDLYPEHGLYGSIPAGEKISSSKNKIFDVPIYSLYGVTKTYARNA